MTSFSFHNFSSFVHLLIKRKKSFCFLLFSEFAQQRIFFFKKMHTEKKKRLQQKEGKYVRAWLVAGSCCNLCSCWKGKAKEGGVAAPLRNDPPKRPLKIKNDTWWGPQGSDNSGKIPSPLPPHFLLLPP